MTIGVKLRVLAKNDPLRKKYGSYVFKVVDLTSKEKDLTMYPMTCFGDNDHNFISKTSDDGKSEMVCSVCSITYERYLEAKQDQEKVKQSIETIINYINGGDHKELAAMMFETMRHTHRTLQQKFLHAMYIFLQKMKDMPTDGRNQDSVAWCKKISEIEGFFPFI